MIRVLAALLFIASQQIVLLLGFAATTVEAQQWLWISSPSLVGPGLVAAWMTVYSPRWPRKSATLFSYGVYGVMLIALFALSRFTSLFSTV